MMKTALVIRVKNGWAVVAPCPELASPIDFETVQLADRINGYSSTAVSAILEEYFTKDEATGDEA